MYDTVYTGWLSRIKLNTLTLSSELEAVLPEPGLAARTTDGLVVTTSVAKATRLLAGVCETA